MSDPALPFRIDYQREGGLLRAHVTGINDRFETTLAYWSVLAEEVRRQGPTCLLVIDEMEGEPPSPEQLELLVHSMLGQGFEGVRVAYVEAHANQIPQVEVGEILAREHGFNARVFGDERAAWIWLRHGMR